MRDNSLEARDLSGVVHGLTDLKQHLDCGPLVIESGKGVWVTDTRGRRYIEAMSGLWCVSLGWGEERLANVAAEQMKTLAYYHLTNHRSHPPVIELAEKLISIAPSPMARVWFASTGSEANDCAVRLAWYHWDAQGMPEKRKIIAHKLAYHGNTIVAASMSGVDYTHNGFGLPLPGFLHVECPHHWKNARLGESEEQYSARLVADLETLILSEGPDTIAAFFTEPVMAAGGVVVPPKGYFDGLQKLLDRYDILLGVDEVVTAFGRLGDMFGSTTMGLKPDLLICAKALSSAYIPISAVMIAPRVWESMVAQSENRGVLGLTMTYSGHPVAAAVAREALRIYEEQEIPQRVRRLEDRFLGGLRELGRKHRLVGEVRGCGLLAGVELARDTSGESPFPRAMKVGPLAQGIGEQHGLMFRAIGDTLAFCPPLVILESEIDELLARLETTLDETDIALRDRCRPRTPYPPAAALLVRDQECPVRSDAGVRSSRRNVTQ
jgi:4-aminobutyrate--pyruvate transaminase